MGLSEKLQKYCLPTLLALGTLSVVPWFALEPINAVKFLFLTVAGAMSFAVIIQNYRIALSDKSGKKSLLVVIFFFAIASALAFLQSEIGWRQQLFGNLGRNTGLIFYLSLLLILIYIVYFSDTTLEKTVQKILHICGIASVAYAMLQFFELDPIGWTNPYSNLIGFQGNPNFQSSFLGLYSILLIHNLLNPSETNLKKAYSGSFIILANFLIVVSDSIQGLFVFFTGASIVIAYAIIQFRIRFFFLTYCLSMAVSFILVILGLLQKGPFSFLYQPSVSYRGDYWRASWKMFEDNFLFGLGFSSFGDYYMSYRDTVSQSGIEGRGADTFSNSAHNVFLDIASSGGLLLLVPYCALIVLSVFYFIRSLRNKSLKSESISLFSALWFAYLLQSIISVQFVTLAFWGWVCLGLILKNEFESNKLVQLKTIAKSSKMRTLSTSQGIQTNSIITISIFVLGTLIGFLPLRATMAQRSAYESQKLDSMISAAYVEVLDSDRMNQISLVLANNNQIPQALKILNRAKEISPRNHDTWLMLSKLNVPGSAQSKKAYEVYLRLNPFGEFKVENDQ